MLCPDIKLQKKPQQNSTRYRTALYLRLSREDGDKTESDSISAPAASRTKAAARAIICGMKNSITSCGTRFRCRSRS